MVIFHYFAAFCIIVITIRVVILFITKESAEEKVNKAITYVIAMVLVVIAWGCIYAFFGYQTDGSLRAPKEVVKSNKGNNDKYNNVVKFKDKDK